jgi:hypothetical protein
MSFHASLENTIISPQAEYILLDLGKIHPATHRMEHKQHPFYIIKIPPSRDEISYTRGTTLLPLPQAGTLF